MIIAILIAAAAIAGGVYLITKNRKEKSNPTPANAVVTWTIGPWINGRSSSVGQPRHPRVSPVGRFELDFPQQPNGPSRDQPSVHYVYRKPAAGELTPGKHLVARFEVAGDAVLDAADGGGLPIVSLWLQRRGDDWSAKGDYSCYRWWSSAVMPLVDYDGKTFELAVPLSYDAWIPVVSGERDEPQRRALFLEALSKAEFVGLTFGGGGGRGHGVYAKQGEATFILKTLSVS